MRLPGGLPPRERPEQTPQGPQAYRTMTVHAVKPHLRLPRFPLETLPEAGGPLEPLFAFSAIIRGALLGHPSRLSLQPRRRAYVGMLLPPPCVPSMTPFSFLPSLFRPFVFLLRQHALVLPLHGARVSA